MRTRGMTFAAGALTVPATAAPATATPAAAAAVKASCSGRGGSGSAAWTWAGKTELHSVSVRAKDNRADGMHPAIRLYWYNGKGKGKSTPWRHVRNGDNHWSTPVVRDRDKVKVAGIEMALFRGNASHPVRDLCGAGKKNPRY
ncbi:hypothetical protein ACGFWI_08595 [Streptomyces sp. NPDC048434]|uniref:hypothetical protein n=1 Tax=Streptomyces sp. NPDC048434 TaxID=3365549 RepID=UPI00371B2E46